MRVRTVMGGRIGSGSVNPRCLALYGEASLGVIWNRYFSIDDFFYIHFSQCLQGFRSTVDLVVKNTSGNRQMVWHSGLQQRSSHDNR